MAPWVERITSERKSSMESNGNTSMEVSQGLLISATLLRLAGYTSEQACSQAKVLEIILRYGPLPPEDADARF
jgi:hypothetical protein